MSRKPRLIPISNANQSLRNLITESHDDSDDIDGIKTTLLNDKDFISQIAKCIGKAIHK